uniref:Macaca fascicularis brain cDNA, clone: QtrA-17673 n=1 Tax=Macaca fascicularis TaxID=9541 RepID=I7GJF2_MACFA|nr:unnamed protein product [Macaca fascicularis]
MLSQVACRNLFKVHLPCHLESFSHILIPSERHPDCLSLGNPDHVSWFCLLYHWDLQVWGSHDALYCVKSCLASQQIWRRQMLCYAGTQGFHVGL